MSIRGIALTAALWMFSVVTGLGALDPALDALRSGSAYVSPVVAGAGAADATARLDALASELNRGGRPVKIAVVPGPVGSPSMSAYAARMKRALGFGGLVVAVAPGRTTGAVGARTRAAITRDLRAARVGTIADPVDRAEAAARAAAGPLLAPANGDGTRAVLALLGLTLIGGTWAAALGVRRTRSRQRELLDNRSALARVRLDAVAARLDALAGRERLGARADDRLDAATRIARRAQGELDQARSADDVPAAEALVNESLRLLMDAEREAGVPTSDDPFAGLCLVDPAHGPATTTGVLDDSGEALRICAACSTHVVEGSPPTRRMIPVNGVAVPFDRPPTG